MSVSESPQDGLLRKGGEDGGDHALRSWVIRGLPDERFGIVGFMACSRVNRHRTDPNASRMPNPQTLQVKTRQLSVCAELTIGVDGEFA
jgi:hypothetical protein